MSDLRQAAEQALKQLQRDDVYLGHRSKTRADAIEALRQALAHEALDSMVAENQRLGLYDDAASYTKLDTTAGVLHKENT